MGTIRKYTFDEYRLARCPRLVGGVTDAGTKVSGDPVLMAKLIEFYDHPLCSRALSCMYNEGCTAKALLESQRSFAVVQPIFTNTVREEAARLGISLSEVRRRRSGK